MRTLLVTPFTPRAGSGRGLRSVGIARALARSGSVDIRYVPFDGLEVHSALLSEPGVALTPLASSRGLRRAVTYARSRSAGVPKALARGISSELIRAGKDSRSYDRLVADGPTAAAALLMLGKVDDVIYNGHNIESGFRATLSAVDRDYGGTEQLRTFERRLMSDAAETWLPTHSDVRSGREIAPEAAFRYMPNVVDVAAITPIAPSKSNVILFLADFAYEPNRNAAHFLVDDVMPILWSQLPKIELALVGRGLELPGPVDSRVHVKGFVPDLDAEYAAAACVVVPLLQGGGSPLKMVEAMAYGIPIVATSIAAAGLEEATAGVHYLQADGAAAIAATVAAACTGDSAEIGRNARALAEEAYSIEALTSLVP